MMKLEFICFFIIFSQDLSKVETIAVSKNKLITVAEMHLTKME